MKTSYMMVLKLVTTGWKSKSEHVVYRDHQTGVGDPVMEDKLNHLHWDLPLQSGDLFIQQAQAWPCRLNALSK